MNERKPFMYLRSCNYIRTIYIIHGRCLSWAYSSNALLFSVSALVQLHTNDIHHPWKMPIMGLFEQCATVQCICIRNTQCGLRQCRSRARHIAFREASGVRSHSIKAKPRILQNPPTGT